MEEPLSLHTLVRRRSRLEAILFPVRLSGIYRLFSGVNGLMLVFPVGTFGAPMSTRPILGSARVLPVATMVALISMLLIGTSG